MNAWDPYGMWSWRQTGKVLAGSAQIIGAVVMVGIVASNPATGATLGLSAGIIAHAMVANGIVEIMEATKDKELINVPTSVGDVASEGIKKGAKSAGIDSPIVDTLADAGGIAVDIVTGNPAGPLGKALDAIGKSSKIIDDSKKIKDSLKKDKNNN